MQIKEIAAHIEKWCPKTLAAEWDNVGLLVGDPNQEVKKVLVALDAIDEVIDEAINNNVNLIVTHHPILIKPIDRVTTDFTSGLIIYKLIRNNISLYSAHTNLDVVQGGINDVLSEKLGLKNTIAFENEGEEYSFVKIGELKNEMSLCDFAKDVKDRLKLENVRIIGNTKAKIKKVAICSGSGMSLLNEVISSGADVFVTGDAKYHDAQEALALGINVIDAGHYGTENIIVPVMKEYLAQLAGIEIIASKVDGNPFKIV